MPPPAYTKYRRLLLQVVMVLVFAGTLGLAAGVRYQRQNAPNVPLDRAMPLGDFRVMVPSAWVSSDTLEIFPLARVVESTEPVDPNVKRVPRVLRVTLYKADPGVTAEQFLRGKKGLTGGSPEPVTVAGQPGVLLTHREPTGYENVWAVHLYAAALVGTDRVVVADLQVIAREPSGRDEKLLRDVAANIGPNKPAAAAGPTPASGPAVGPADADNPPATDNPPGTGGQPAAGGGDR